MDDKLTTIKIVFDNVKEMRSEILILFDNLNVRINKLKEMYSEFVKYTQSTKTSDVKSVFFSLDSFYFQTCCLAWLQSVRLLKIVRSAGSVWGLW